MERHDISFDESDRNLFQVEDARLRADALRHSILPRLHVVMNEAIAGIRNIYGVDVLEDSIVTYAPQFRTRRDTELSYMYESAFVGLAGKRQADVWSGVTKEGGRPVKFLPFKYVLEVSELGLSVYFSNYWLKGLTSESYEKYLDFHLQFEGLTHRLCYLCNIKPIMYSAIDGVRPIALFKDHYGFMKRNKLYGNDFVSCRYLGYPIDEKSVDQLIHDFVFFFPVYDSYIQISKGMPVRFLELIARANDFLDSLQDEPDSEAVEAKPSVEHTSLPAAAELAALRVRVMPALRWQVFQRDRWKCVACGRGSHDDVILHVDHIIPRSRGGTDSLNNFQTLCDRCNIGKSNRDDTDLRSAESPPVRSD